MAVGISILSGQFEDLSQHEIGGSIKLSYLLIAEDIVIISSLAIGILAYFQHIPLPPCGSYVLMGIGGTAFLIDLVAFANKDSFKKQKVFVEDPIDNFTSLSPIEKEIYSASLQIIDKEERLKVQTSLLARYNQLVAGEYYLVCAPSATFVLCHPISTNEVLLTKIEGFAQIEAHKTLYNVERKHPPLWIGSPLLLAKDKNYFPLAQSFRDLFLDPEFLALSTQLQDKLMENIFKERPFLSKQQNESFILIKCKTLCFQLAVRTKELYIPHLGIKKIEEPTDLSQDSKCIKTLIIK